MALLRPGVDFTNILSATFMPKDHKKTDNLTVFFCSWDLCDKAAHKIVVKLAPAAQG
jgi:hypothetical protein